MNILMTRTAIAVALAASFALTATVPSYALSGRGTAAAVGFAAGAVLGAATVAPGYAGEQGYYAGEPNYAGETYAYAPDAYAAPDAMTWGRGRSDVTASQPGFNPALDRAKGSL